MTAKCHPAAMRFIPDQLENDVCVMSYTLECCLHLLKDIGIIDTESSKQENSLVSELAPVFVSDLARLLIPSSLAPSFFPTRRVCSQILPRLISVIANNPPSLCRSPFRLIPLQKLSQALLVGLSSVLVYLSTSHRTEKRELLALHQMMNWSIAG
ncbi:hypothetical protein L6452_34405 [Arctium lappa]|uniref:Uncharacterized protein n=1 Tax=Arctium lappa TaxID=4217 RepID=A0ACB8YHE0_ARCLA|nr:hypothetical protein L6452_34405 [Arctium lappa]